MRSTNYFLTQQQYDLLSQSPIHLYTNTPMDASCVYFLYLYEPPHQLSFLSSPSLSGQGAPRPRKGHSFLNIKTANNSIYGGYTYLVMFGGNLPNGTQLMCSIFNFPFFLGANFQILCYVLIIFNWNSAVIQISILLKATLCYWLNFSTKLQHF